MKIKRCKITNFRVIQDIDLYFNESTCLIAGPNAIGKSTILEAIRLNRSLLLNRFPSEGQFVLHSLGATQNPNQMMFRSSYFDFTALAGDPDRSIEINIDISLEADELSRIKNAIHRISMDYLRGQMGGQGLQEQSALAQFLSSSKGQEHLSQANKKITEYISTIRPDTLLSLYLQIDPSGQIKGKDAATQVICAFLERSIPPGNCLFSYFSADRALPAGEAPIQIGSGDSDNQIKSHIAEPQLKYSRLKNSIATSVLFGENVKNDFELIFNKVLPGKRLHGIGIGPTGNFRVQISEEGIRRPFDIDSLSSGEKGLILTFLLIRKTVINGGIILIDEPELHLNPGVCRRLLNFLVDECVKPKNLQAIICTHSADILNNAYERDDCGIHHLKSPENATPIYKGDFDEMFQAMGRLGISPAESFFFETRVFVEGDHDKEILEEGFRSVLGDRCQIISLGGRKAVEHEIKNLQISEKENKLDRVNCFIFDRDRKISNLTSSKKVKIIQWDRYCLENYLINLQILYDVFKSVKGNKLTDRGSFNKDVKNIALSQIKKIAIESVYNEMRPNSPGIGKKDYDDQLEITATNLESKLENLKIEVTDILKRGWRKEFITRVEAKQKRLHDKWENQWMIECNGKELLENICNKFKINYDRKEIKKIIAKKLYEAKCEEWRIVAELLKKTIVEE